MGALELTLERKELPSRFGFKIAYKIQYLVLVHITGIFSRVAWVDARVPQGTARTRSAF